MHIHARFALGAAVAATLVHAATAQVSIFSPSALPAGPNETPGIARSRMGSIDPAVITTAQAGSHLRLDLFDDTRIDLIVSRAWSTSINGVAATTLEGTILGQPVGSFTLSLASGQISATIASPDGNFGLAPSGTADSLGRPAVIAQQWAPGAAVRCAIAPGVDAGAARPQDHHEHQHGDPGEPLEQLAGAAPTTGACSCFDDGSSLDVLFVYTTLAKNAAGGASALQARLADAVAANNLAWTNSLISGVGVDRYAVRIAGFSEITYNEVSPEWLDHLSRLADPDDGSLDFVLPMRDAARADAVCLIIDDTRFTGGAAFYALYVRDAAAITLNWRAMGSGSLTLAHELGHTHGCAHDRPNSSFALFPYAWGHSFAANSTTYGTIMSYTGANLVPLFSNPTLNFAGQPVGVGLDQPLPSYNALAIREARWTVAQHAASLRIIDCNGNGVRDDLDITSASSRDDNGNCRPDECERRIYVDAGNTGTQDGLSWNTAYTDLATAMIAASLECSNISEIWIADGTYKPTIPGSDASDRFAHFRLRSGLALIGSFQGKSRPGGGESSPLERSFALGGTPTFPTILSGDIGIPGVHTDNAFNVVVADRTNWSARLDGCVIERGYSDFGGAGIDISDASPTIRNCTFRNNRAGGGAGAHIAGMLSAPSFTDCTFQNNTATGSGGCVTIRDGAAATFAACEMRDSSATYGGALSLFAGASAALNGCVLEQNSAAINSGAIDCFSNSSLTLAGCALRNNTAGTGGGGSGGAMIIHTDCTASLADCTFVGNSCPGTGGAAWVQDSHLDALNCTFQSNTCGDGGGALSAYQGSSLTLIGCSVRNNHGRWGGAAALGDSLVIAERTHFHANGATAFSGGALDLFNAADCSLVSCALTGNSAADGGGGISLGSGSSISIANSTIAANSATNSGGGIGMFGSSLLLQNSILFGNSAAIAGLQDKQLTVFSGTRTVNRSCVQGLTGSLGGSGNIGSDPLLVAPATGGVSLNPGSPCIDAGSNTLLPFGQTLDVLGNPRRVDDPSTADSGVGTAPIVDIGAAEFDPTTNTCPADFNQDGDLNPDDLGDYINCYFAPVPCDGADFNGDGDNNPDDLGDYINAYFGGCP